MTTVTDAVATRHSGPIQIMWGRKKHFDAVLPASVDVEAFLGTAAGALYASDVPGNKLTLMSCAVANPDSLMVALMECAALGHMPGTDEYYLTPRLDHGRPRVLGIEGYRGVIERMYRSGAVRSVVVREVCEKDYFVYVEGETDKPVHKFGGGTAGTSGAAFFAAAQSRGEMLGCYAYAELTTGAVSRVVILTRDDIHAARDSGGYKPDDKYSPWNRLDGGAAHPEFTGRSMWWKTAAKRLEPWVPTSREYRREMLSASAAAAELAGRREMPPVSFPAAEAAAQAPDIHDAEIVPDRQRSGSGPTGAALGRLGKLLAKVPLGEPEDVAVWLEHAGGAAVLEGLDADGARHAEVALTKALELAQGDAAQAASILWTEYKEAHGETDG